jgi:hypothetical protein
MGIGADGDIEILGMGPSGELYASTDDVLENNFDLQISGRVLVRSESLAGEEIVINPSYDYGLWVAGHAVMENPVLVPQGLWPDYVFADDYKLPALDSVSNYIHKNGHLPGIPSQKKVLEEGYSQHDINAALLEKIEELTLYRIQQQKSSQSIEQALLKQSEEIVALKKKLN